jgi:hypothetical protein
MNIFEIIRGVADIAIALFTLALVWVTWILAKHTKLMSDRDVEQQRMQDLRRCIYLAESIVNLDNREFGDWSTGEWSSNSVHPFNELLALGNYLHDSDTKRSLEHVTSALTSLLSNKTNSMFTGGPMKDALDKLRDRLTQEIIELQRELGNYSRSQK